MNFYCMPMKRHFMTTAAGNTSVALSMAKEVWCHDSQKADDITALVEILNKTSLKIIAACERHAADSRANGAPTDAPIGKK